jgi:hypothetical protein
MRVTPRYKTKADEPQRDSSAFVESGLLDPGIA